MFCVYCGTKLPDEARFCFMCGKKVEPADNAENIVAANSGSIDEEEFSIEIQEDPTTSSSEKSPDAPEPAIEEDLVEEAHNAFATTNENDPAKHAFLQGRKRDRKARLSFPVSRTTACQAGFRLQEPQSKQRCR